MAVAYLLRYKTSQPSDILTQLRAYKERELDRSPRQGFRLARLLTAADGKSVAFYSEWDDADALEDMRDSVPWEACIDLVDVHADGSEETVFEID
ncbi:MAG: hypothetical protein WBG82_03970 [Parvibaculum sp.]|uniref:hypothetical protein n=1 Tax=Parvibaculum sp. TaxID=2024848 RepID=UPI003C751491